jgi:maleylpyruvate isomerase
MTVPVLHNYFRSSTSHRVRIALALKGVAYDYKAYHLRHGEQRQPQFLDINAQGLVPALTWTDGTILTQSLAIMEFIEETIPEPPLLPKDSFGRARVRSLSQMIALDIHPINNLRVLNYLRDNFQADDESVALWFRHWVVEAFGPLEQRLSTEPQTGRFCHGDNLTMADICLAAQLANNRRFAVDMSPYPTISRISLALSQLPAFEAAAPENQPDRE